MGMDDFMVTNIDFVVARNRNKDWKIEHLTNKEFYILAFATDGKAFYHIDDKKFEIERGDILFFQKGQVHSATTAEHAPWSYYSIAFDLDCDGRLPLMTRAAAFYRYEKLLQRLYYEWTAKNKGYKTMCRSLMMELICMLEREQNRSRSEMIEDIKNYMIENYDKNLTIEQLAKMAGVSKSHFHMLFKESTGMSAIQYHNKIKMNMARDLLQSGGCNVTQTAQSVGFDDIYYFSRLFKKIIGVNPSSFIHSSDIPLA